MSTDLSDPKYLKPFKYGWKRELVWRATNDNSSKRNGDIYYYTPSGKKVRSMREVAENLKNKELSLDNFTFFKESLGIEDPEKEIIRDAKNKAGPVTLAKKAVTKTIKSPKSPKLPSSNLKISSPKVSSPKVGTNETADSPVVKTKAATKSLGNFKVISSLYKFILITLIFPNQIKQSLIPCQKFLLTYCCRLNYQIRKTKRQQNLKRKWKQMLHLLKPLQIGKPENGQSKYYRLDIFFPGRGCLKYYS